jgi:hypothetical protein
VRSEVGGGRGNSRRIAASGRYTQVVAILTKPKLVYHADWGSKDSKRWCAKATLGSDGRYTASGPRPVGDPSLVLKNLKAEAGEQAIVFAGFDFPIGIPAYYAKRSGIASFRGLLAQLGNGDWKSFYSVCDSPQEISVFRPFFPNRSKKGCLPRHLFAAHGVTTVELLLRRCEKGGNGRKQACSLFWTLGGKQVGKAAIIGWRDILVPSIQEHSVRLWPFDGELTILFGRGNVVVAETYPAECYGWFPGDPLRSKKDIESRGEFGSRMLSWANAKAVSIEQNLHGAIKAGFPNGGDDAFDAVVGLFGMLQVCIGQRESGEPSEPMIHEIEGWILGRES